MTIHHERITAEEYIDFLKRTDLGSQYPKERFRERIEKLVKIAEVLQLDLLDILASAGLYSDTPNSNTRLISDEDFAFLTKVDLEYIRCFIHALVEKRKGSQQ